MAKARLYSLWEVGVFISRRQPPEGGAYKTTARSRTNDIPNHVLRNHNGDPQVPTQDNHQCPHD